LLKKNEDLAKKMKTNKDAIRKLEKEMEEHKSVLANKRRILNREKNKKIQAMEEKRAARVARSRKIANKKLKRAQAKLNAVSQRMRGVKGRKEDAETTLKRAQSKVDQANQEIKALKAKGEHVPDDHRDDFSSPHAWKPPGYRAAKALAEAKEALAKAQSVFKKANAEFQSRDVKRKATLDMLEQAQQMKKSALSSVATPARANPEVAKTVMKVSSMKKRKAGKR